MMQVEPRCHRLQLVAELRNSELLDAAALQGFERRNRVPREDPVY